MDTFSMIQQDEKCKKLFYLLPKAEIQKLELQHFRKGQALMSAGESPAHIYIILDGICVLEKETRVSACPQVISRLGYLDVIGMYEIIRNISRVGSVYAYTDCTVVAISSALGIEWIDRYPRFMLELCAYISDRYYVAQDYVNYYSKYTVNCAVISYLLSEWNLYTRKESGASKIVKLGCTRKGISETVGRDLRSVNRTIGILNSMQLIRLEKGKICLTSDQVRRLEEMRDREMDGKSL